MADLQRFQSPYNFVPVPELQTYLEQSLKSMDALVSPKIVSTSQ